MNLPRKWENAIDKAMKERIWGCSRSELQLLAYKLCALTQKPQRELTDAEIVSIQKRLGTRLSGCVSFARDVIAAHQRKQQEPEKVTVAVYFYQLENGDVIASSVGPAPIKQDDAAELVHTQEIEVTLP